MHTTCQEATGIHKDKIQILGCVCERWSKNKTEEPEKLIAVREEMGLCVGVANALLFPASDLCTRNSVQLYLRHACQPAVFSYPLHFSHFLLRFMDMRKNNVSNTYESCFPSRHTMLNPFIHMSLYSIDSSSLITHMNQSDWFFAVPCHRLSPRC